MKKFIVLIVAIIILSSCQNGHIGQVGSPTYPLKVATPIEKEEYINKYVMVIDVTHNGETHEYVCSGANGDGQRFSIGGHWEGCKYCKENK